jgi:VWFA-related protein
MHRIRGFVAASAMVAASAFFALPTTAQDQKDQSGQQPAIKAQVNLVNLFATVRDKNKRIVNDLTQKDFKVFEEGQEQQIAFFSKEVTLPITLALLLDTSGSEQYMLGAIQEAGAGFLNRVLRKGDEALIMSFDTDVDLLADFTDDRGILDRAIRQARVNTPGGGMVNPGPVGSRQITGTALYDAIYLSCNEKLSTEAGRKAIVIVTDAQDEGSKVRIEEAVEAAQRTDAVIHILLVADPRGSFGFGGGGNQGAAHKLADDTGGRVIVVNSEKHLMQAFDEISDELRSQYTLGYYPTNSTPDGKFRKIKIDLANHDLKILARKGYYAPKG